MFITVPESEVPVPLELTTRQCSHWRAIECDGHGFFLAVLTVRGDKPGVPRTILISWDSDLVHFVESPKMAATVHSLSYVVAAAGNPSGVIQIRKVHEIWRGVDHEAHGAEVIVFKTVDGSQFCGSEAVPVPESVQALSLIATVQQTD